MFLVLTPKQEEGFPLEQREALLFMQLDLMALLHQDHALGLREITRREPVEVRTTRQTAGIPCCAMLTRAHALVYELGDLASHHVVDDQRDLRRFRQGKANLSGWVEGIRIVAK